MTADNELRGPSQGVSSQKMVCSSPLMTRGERAERLASPLVACAIFTPRMLLTDCLSEGTFEFKRMSSGRLLRQINEGLFEQ